MVVPGISRKFLDSQQEGGKNFDVRSHLKTPKHLKRLHNVLKIDFQNATRGYASVDP